jgi:hypothetical protein
VLEIFITAIIALTALTAFIALAALTAFLAWRAYNLFLGLRAFRQDPVFVADSYLRNQLQDRGVDPSRVDQDSLAKVATKNVLKARRPDGSVDPNALCDLLQREAAHLASATANRRHSRQSPNLP